MKISKIFLYIIPIIFIYALILIVALTSIFASNNKWRYRDIKQGSIYEGETISIKEVKYFNDKKYIAILLKVDISKYTNISLDKFALSTDKNPSKKESQLIRMKGNEQSPTLEEAIYDHTIKVLLNRTSNESIEGYITFTSRDTSKYYLSYLDENRGYRSQSFFVDILNIIRIRIFGDGQYEGWEINSKDIK